MMGAIYQALRRARIVTGKGALARRFGRARGSKPEPLLRSELEALARVAPLDGWPARRLRRADLDLFLARGLVRKINGPGAIELYEVTDAGRALVASRGAG